MPCRRTAIAITTVEGLAQPDGRLSILQDSFCEAHGLQCGYCTPGMLIAAQALLNANPRPTEDEIRDAIGGNLCRCTGYQQIVERVVARGAAHGRGNDMTTRAAASPLRASAISAPNAGPRSIRASSPGAAAMPPTSPCPA